MKFDELAILLNCHTFQDFPTHATGQDADSLLAHWTALWHPQFIADAGKMPTWYRADSPPTHDRARLLSVPRNQLLSSPDVVTREVMAAGGCVISDTTSREEFFAQLQGMPDGPALATALPPLPDTESPAADQLDLVEDFFALGYAYLQVELLTRQMRHSTRVQETAFEEQLVAAARAALRGERDTCRESLQTCYDFLSQERDHYYAVDVYLIDVSLLAVPYCGAGLRKQLRETSKSNLLLTADLLLHLEQKEPESLALLRQTLDEHRVGLIGGEYSSWPLQLLSTETARSQLTQGRAEFQRVLGLSPRVFGRHRFGLNPSLPALLHHFGFTGVLHATLDGGRFPEGSQSKSRWEGDGQRSLDAILRAPLDASQSGIFLALATSIGESMDMDHIATRCFAHWSGEISPWYRDLQRATRFTRALGRFVTLDEYFKDTYDPGLHDRFSADEYRSPFLQQPLPEVKERPISSIVQYWHQQILLQQWSQLTTLCLLVKDTEAARSAHERAQSTIDEWNRTPLDASWESRFAEVPALLERSANDLATALSATTQPSSIPGPNASDGARLLINPLSFPRRVGPVLLDHPPTVQAPVYAIDEHQGTVSVIADVPSMGLARLCAGPPAKRRGKLPPPIADGEWLRNDFLEAHIDRQTGALRAVKDYGSRTNRLSQQLAYRWLPASNGPGGYYPKPEPHYSQMIGESLHIEHADTVVGRIATTGRLIDDKQTTLARFKQTYQLVRGSRTLEIEVEIQPEIQPDGEPWDNYYGCRFAWSNEASDLARSLADGRRATTARQFESPLFVEIEDGQHRTVVITGGLAFHRTVGRRMLDSLLIVRNEPQRKFRVGIAIDPKQPFREALAFFAPTIQLANSHHPIATNSAWLFHIDARHVMISNCLPLWKDDRVAGVRIRLVEIEGRSGPVLIRSFRSFANARKVDAAGQTAEQCDVDSEGIRLNIAAHELVELEASFV